MTAFLKSSAILLAVASASIGTAIALGPSDAAAQGGPRVIELEDEVIKGRVQKPEAFYILQHASLNYKRLDAKDTFIPELVNTVKHEPF